MYTVIDSTEREKLWAMVKRTNALSDRVANRICQRIVTCNDLSALDGMFTLSERAHDLFMRIHARYEALCGGLEG